MAKRGAVKELTHENWADEEEPEEMGMFRQASSEQLAGRQIKKARRRAVASEDSTSGVFKGFTSFAGFGGNKDSSSQPSFSFLSGDATTKSTFDILNTAKTNTTTSCSTKSEVGSPEKKASTQLFKVTKESLAGAPKEAESIKTNGVGPAKVKADSSGRGGNKVFLSHLKALNEGVVLWVKQHLDTNPHINLSPVFDDYKKHFEELSKKYPAVSDNESDLETIATTACNKDNASEKENQPVPVKSNFSFSGSVSSSSEKPSFSFSLGSATEKKSSDSPTKPSFSFGDFGKKSPEKSIFSSKSGIFGGMDSSALGSTSTTTSTTTTTTATTTITTAKPETEQNPDEASDEPPKVEVTEVKEDDAIYEKKCKLFYMKDGAYVEKGVGTLFLKPAGEKTQLLVRALTNLGNILLNIILNPTVPTARMGKNSVLIVCVPNPPLSTNSESSEPVKMLIRVKTGEDADALHEKINELKK